MEPWQLGQQLLTDFDIKLGRLAASVKNRPCTPADIKRSCDTVDLIILSVMRQDHDEKRQ